MPQPLDAAAADPPDREPVDVALKDGSTLRIRPVHARDADAMAAFFGSLSLESLGLRFFGVPSAGWAAKWALDPGHGDRCSLVATTGPQSTIVGHGAYIRVDPHRAEVAFVVADRWQGHGIATIMLGQLAAAALEHGIEVLIAEVLPRNHRMIDVFRDSGFPVELHTRGDVIDVEFPTSLTSEAVERFEGRERIAAVAALRSFLRPSAVAVIAASHRRGTVGGELLHRLRAAGFAGGIHAVNGRGRASDPPPVHSSIAEVPERVELALIADAAVCVEAAARECGAAGVRALVVLAAGFADSGPAGADRQRELLAICRESGMRLIGPDCLGVLNAAPDVRLHATAAGPMPQPGRVAFLSQSGALGIAILELAGRSGLGFSSFVSVGNKADISGNDLLQYWEVDPATDVILLYLESFGNPRRFARIARRVGAAKPIIAVKGGRSAAGARATTSHTGAFLASSDITVDALFEQAGVIRADTIHELFGVAALLAEQPAPAGRRVAIVTNAGGPGILAADSCAAEGLEVVALPPEITRRLRDQFPPEASLANPIDMLATASGEDYARAVRILVESGAADAILTIFVPPLLGGAGDAVQAIARAARDGRGVTIASVFMGTEVAGRAGVVPVFGFPEDAVRALAHAARYGSWRAQPRGTVLDPPDARPDEAASIIAAALGDGAGWLEPMAVLGLLGCYGLPMLRWRRVGGVGQAVAAAAEIGGAVALKAVATDLLHKSDAGGVRLGLRSGAAVRRAAAAMRRDVGASGRLLDGYLVQPMAPDGVELLIGVANDASFGPVIVCGAGAPAADLARDAAVRITPLTDVDAREMLRSLRSFPLLTGHGGTVPCDIEAIQDVLMRLSALVEAHPEIAELDLNPLVASAEGALIVDARVRVEAPAPTRALSALRS